MGGEEAESGGQGARIPGVDAKVGIGLLPTRVK